MSEQPEKQSLSPEDAERKGWNRGMHEAAEICERRRHAWGEECAAMIRKKLDVEKPAES